MIVTRGTRILAFALGLWLMAAPRSSSQEAGKPNDEALDSLLKKLADPADGPTAKPEKPATPEAAGPKSDQPDKGSQPEKKPQPPTAQGPQPSEPGSGSTPAADKAGKATEAKRDGAATIAPKDQEVDELLQKLGETKETPAPDDRPR